MSGYRELEDACRGLLAFIQKRYPDDFREGGRGYICPHHIAINDALQRIDVIPTEQQGRDE